MPEFKILNDVLDYMESKGTTYKQVQQTINDELVETINTANNTSFTLEDLQRATDKCLAHEWLIRSNSSNDKYLKLKITPKGIGAARSKKKADELKASRSFLKKVSDYIEDHRGLFIALAFLLGIATLILKITGNK